MTSDDWQITDCGLCGTSDLCRIFRVHAAGWRVPLCASCIAPDPNRNGPAPTPALDTGAAGSPITADEIRTKLAEIRRTLDTIADDLNRQRSHLADTLADLRKKSARNP